MRHPFLPVLAFLFACRGEVFIDEAPLEGPPPGTDPTSEPSTGFETGPWEQPTTATEPDTSMWDGAWIRILSPPPDGVVPIGSPYEFEAVVYSAQGEPMTLAPDRVRWFASEDPDFESDVLAFQDASLAIGTHELTVIADLPNGDRVAHAVAGVKVQSAIAGTYAGLFSVDGTVTQITITCTGAAVIAIVAEGDSGAGDGECLVSILGVDVPMTWDFELVDDAGTLTGEAAVNLLGFFSYDVPMTAATVDPAGDGLELEFAGDIPFVGTLSAFLRAPRVSLDAE